MKVMAKKPVNKSAVVRDYLAKYPEKGPAAIAQQINQDKGLKLPGKFVTSVKTKLKQASDPGFRGAAVNGRTRTGARTRR
jgi:hypothetical protein